MERLTLVVFALLQAKDIRHAELAARFPGSAQTSSVIRRIERFFDRHPLCQADVARVVLTLLPDKRPREFILDRTNWKYGTTDVNVLLLAVLWRGVAIPLLFELLAHGGSSDTKLRHSLMDDALCLLEPADLQVCVRSLTWPPALRLSGHSRSFLSGSFSASHELRSV